MTLILDWVYLIGLKKNSKWHVKTTGCSKKTGFQMRYSEGPYDIRNKPKAGQIADRWSIGSLVDRSNSERLGGFCDGLTDRQTNGHLQF